MGSSYAILEGPVNTQPNLFPGAGALAHGEPRRGAPKRGLIAVDSSYPIVDPSGIV